MTRYKTFRYRCDYCHTFTRAKQSGIREHEIHCFKRGDRIPWYGEIRSDFDGIIELWDGNKWNECPHSLKDGTPIATIKASDRIDRIKFDGQTELIK